MQFLDRRSFVFCVAAAALTGSAFAQDDKALVGTWNMTSETGEDPVAWALILKEVEGKLTASVGVGDEAQPVKDFTSAGGELKFKVPYQGADYEIALKATADKLSGTWSGGGDSGKTSGVKK